MSGRKQAKSTRKQGPKKPTAQQRKAQSNRDRARSRQQGESKSKVAPVAKSRTVHTGKPKMTTLSNGDCIITHREYVADIVAGTGTPSVFTVTSFPMNPGLSSSFQWLSRIAANYESYEFQSLSAEYETEAPTSLGGTLIVTLDYDAADAAPSSKQQAMSYRGSVRSAPWNACTHKSLKEDLSKFKSNFVRVGAQPTGTDIKTYDIGNLFVMSQGVTTAGSVLGELYLCYTVKLMTPVFEVFSSQFGGSITAGGTISQANPLGSVPVLGAGTFGLSANATSVVTFVTAGTYYATIEVTGTVLTASGFGTLVNCTAVNLGPSLVNAAGTSLNAVWQIVATQQNATATLTVTGTTVTATQVYIGARPP